VLRGDSPPSFGFALVYLLRFFKKIPNIVSQYKIPKTKSSELIPSFMKRYPVLHTEQIDTLKSRGLRKKRGRGVGVKLGPKQGATLGISYYCLRRH